MSKTSEELMKITVQAIEEKKGMDVTVLNLQGISLVADYFIICHGNSDTQVKAITAEVKKQAVESGANIKGIEGNATGRWVLVDMGDVIAHIFHREDRQYYNIERLWSDAKVVEPV
jgi:ribosome-associated protein